MLLDVSSIKGFLIICHHKMRGKIVMPSLYYCIPLSVCQSSHIRIWALFSPPSFFFFFNGFNTQSAFRVQKTDYLIASGRLCVNKWWTSMIVPLAKTQCHLQLILLQSICWIWQFTLVTMNQFIHKQQHQNPKDNHISSNGKSSTCNCV